MATTFEARWLLFISLVNLYEVFLATGPPAPPSTPRCRTPCDADNCWDIHCDWDPGLNTQVSTNYSLHWERDNHNEDSMTTGSLVNGIIYREKYSKYSQLSVWVQAENQYGFANSQKISINTGHILQPPPPTIAWSQQDLLEMSCNSTCNPLHNCLKSCEVRYRPEGEQDWIEIEIGPCVSYEFSYPLQPAVMYEFQVRCACCTGLISEWGVSHSIRSPEAAPEGQIDVWKDCGIFPSSSDCVLVWKKLPIAQAHGDILGYKVILSHINGTDVVEKVSTAAPKNQLVCDEKNCYLNYSLKNVLSASVSAYNSHGATLPSSLVIPVQGEEQKKKAIYLNMRTNNLTVSWNHSKSLSSKEYVVQYKQAGSHLGQGIDWVKVNNCDAVFEGTFQNYTPYQVTLFTLSPNGSHHQSSVIGYSVEGAPSVVSTFQVVSIAAKQATLLWIPRHLSEQNGVILYYQIGIANQNKVYNVTASSWHENMSYELKDLRPEQAYEVWIRAVTVAGPGASATVRFNTKEINSEKSVYLTAALLPTILIVIFLFGCPLCAWRGAKACPLVSKCLNEKVPDPHNSRIFQHMTHQIHDSSVCICTPICESQPKISVLEVVENQAPAVEVFLKKPSQPDRLMNPVAGCSQAEWHDVQREEFDPTEHRYRREQYSKMVDSDEENDREDCWNSLAEEEFPAGYEKHFMPTAQEIMQC